MGFGFTTPIEGGNSYNLSIIVWLLVHLILSSLDEFRVCDSNSWVICLNIKIMLLVSTIGFSLFPSPSSPSPLIGIMNIHSSKWRMVELLTYPCNRVIQKFLQSSIKQGVWCPFDLGLFYWFIESTLEYHVSELSFANWVKLPWTYKICILKLAQSFKLHFRMTKTPSNWQVTKVITSMPMRIL